MDGWDRWPLRHAGTFTYRTPSRHIHLPHAKPGVGRRIGRPDALAVQVDNTLSQPSDYASRKIEAAYTSAVPPRALGQVGRYPFGFDTR